MARFDRYLLQQLMLVFGFFSFVLIMIYWINQAVRLFDQLIADGQSAWVFLEFTALSLPSIILIAVPLAAVIAGIYATNRLSQDSELVVLQATGFSAFRLARPAAYFGMIVFVVLSILIHFLAPIAYKRLQSRTVEVSQNMTARLLTPGKFIEPAAGYTVYIRDVTPSGELRDLFVSDTTNPDTHLTYTASSAYLVRADGDLQLVMTDGLVQSLRRDDNRLFTTSFQDFVLTFDDAFAGGQDIARDTNMLSTPQLLSASAQDRSATGKTRVQMISVAHGRVAASLLGFVGPLIGFACLILGGFSRFGVWRQIVLAILLVVVIKAIETAALNVVRNNPDLWALSYLHILVGLTMVAVMLYLSDHPSLIRRRRTGTAAS